MGSKPSFSEIVTVPPNRAWGEQVTPWCLGLFGMSKDLTDAGFDSVRLVEQMYTASQVFEHNLAVRARQHGMRVR